MFNSLNKFLQDFSPLTSFLSSIIGLIFSGLTLWLAWLAYTKFIKNKLLEKQLDVVIHLIEVLRDTNFQLIFYQHETSNLDNSYKSEISQIELTNGYKVYMREKSIFELANLPDHSLFKKESIFVDISITEIEKEKIDNIVKLALNPIMPKSIAILLKRFKISEDTFIVGSGKNIHKSVSYVCIGRGEVGEFSDVSGFYSDEDGLALTSWGEFIRSCQFLSKSIEKWMKNHGIKEINL